MTNHACKILLTVALGALPAATAAAATETPALVVEAADTPVKIGRATVLTVAGDPPVLYYAATNQTADEFEQFTVHVFIFDAKGMLRTEQIAPGRRILEAKGTKYSTIVLDGGPVEPAGTVVIGVNQVQRTPDAISWRTELRAAAEAAVAKKKP